MNSSSVNPSPRLAGVVGWPVSHSLSPLIHRVWADREVANAFYAAIAAPPDDESFERIVRGLMAAGYAGVNVTIPHKERALALADTASEAAAAIGAANMLSFRNEAIHADNSDAAGFADSVLPALSHAPGQIVLVLGAGGAARAVIYAVQQMGRFSAAIIVNRGVERAARLADAFTTPDFRIEARSWRDADASVGEADLIVNTTALGMTGQPPLPLSLESGRPGTVVFDSVYTPSPTALLCAARDRGFATVDGLEMLMRQAAPGYRAWLGENAVVDASLRGCLEEALARRAGGPA